jgi:2-methylisocitrate lyase-like PEP mutase family enzyme
VLQFADQGADVVFIDALASKGEMQEFCRAVPGTPKMVKNVVYELDLMKMHKIRQGHIECDSWLRAKDARCLYGGGSLWLIASSVPL